ncbi:MAG: hypothetical protein U0520_00740 [Candidatus Saccharimonadales bacterium]
MKTVILYRPNSEGETSVQAYIREFERETGRSIELIDSTTVSGVQVARLYDVVQFPAIIAMREDGSFIEIWQERSKWPTISELSFYN